MMIRQLYNLKMYVKMSKINMIKMDVRTFWLQLYIFYPFHPTELEIIILSFEWIRQS